MVIKKRCLIIGTGAAGMSAGTSFLLQNRDQEFDPSDSVIAVGFKLANTSLSPWNMRSPSDSNLKEKIAKGGSGLGDELKQDAFVENYRESVEFLKRSGIEFKPSNIGIIPEEPQQALDKLQQRYLELGGEICRAVVSQFIIDTDGNICGVKINNSSKSQRIIADQIIIAAGGLTNLFDYTSGFSHESLPNIMALSLDAGLELNNLEFMMYHPFLIVDSHLPRNLVSGELLQYAEFITEDGQPFLSNHVREALRNNNHHDIFGKMTREFYRQSEKSNIYMDISDISEHKFKKYVKENEYGWVFEGKELEEVQTFQINPTFHYSLGGIKTSTDGETVQDGVYAVGEIATGLHGANRIGGMAIPEAVVFGRIAGSKAATVASEPTPTVDTTVGNTGLTRNIKQKTWKNLGPIKRRNDLLNFLEELNTASSPSSEEKLISEIVKSVLDRTENIGSHYIIN